MARKWAGAELDLEAIYRAPAAELSRFIARLSGHADSADVLHEVFLVAERRLRELEPDANVRSWLYAIAVRVVSAQRRKQRLRRWLWLESGAGDAPGEPLDESTPETVAVGREATRRVYAVLERLSERDRTLIVLFELEGLAAREIASVVALREDAVWVGLSRARARFRQRFVELFGVDGSPA